jgi:putative glutathione S-transferase
MGSSKVSLPPGLLIRTGKLVWTTMWRTMMSQMAPSSQGGDYIRPESEFRQWVGQDSQYPAATGRYRLIVGMGCPWAHRTLVTRALKGLTAVIDVIQVVPSPDEGCWVFAPPFWAVAPYQSCTARPNRAMGGVLRCRCFGILKLAAS